MGARPNLTAASFFLMRTPLLPWKAQEEGQDTQGSAHVTSAAARRSVELDGLRKRVRSPVVREALYLASPSLDSAVESWLNDPSDPRARGVSDIATRYLARMAGRSTPFGLFSGCTLGRMGSRTDLHLVPATSYRRHTRLDVHYLAALGEGLEADPALQARLPLCPNTSLCTLGDELRYAEARTDAKTHARSYHLVSVPRTGYLAAVLESARGGTNAGDLAAALSAAHPEVTLDEAKSYVASVVEAKLLTSPLAPQVTGDPPLTDLIATLRQVPAAEPSYHALCRADAALRALDQRGLGQPSSAYQNVSDILGQLPASVDPARLFHVDLHKPALSAELGPRLLGEVERAVQLLARVGGRARTDDALAPFRQAFEARYGTAWVPLVEVLDDDLGIPFQTAFAGSSDPTPALQDLPFPPDPNPASVPFGRREAHLLRGIHEVLRSGGIAWNLSDADLEQLSSDSPPPLPSAFSATISLAARSAEAVDRGDFQLTLHYLSGPSGASLLGRFCHGDDALREQVRAYLASEEAAEPEAVFAEIVHLPEGRLGNLLCRPTLRRWEIVYHGRSGAPLDRQLEVGDLLLGVRAGQLALWSKKLDKRVIPRLTTAHNWRGASLGVYRLLSALQSEGQGHVGAFQWGPLASAPFLPRVCHGRVALSPATWNLQGSELRGLLQDDPDARLEGARSLRGTLKLPRWVGLVEGDNVLPVDLDSPLHLESLAKLVKGRDTVTLVEQPDPELLLVEGPEGTFVHELVVPFLCERPASRVGGPRQAERISRLKTPASDWLYVKLYTGTAAADRVLREVVAPLARDAKRRGVADRWHFLRYADPDGHLRVRFRGDPQGLLSETLPTLRQALDALPASCPVWRLQVDSYEREVERYGGAHGIELCEAIFEVDSEAVLDALSQLGAELLDEGRFYVALRGVHTLLVDLGLPLAERRRLMARARARFAKEHHVDKSHVRQAVRDASVLFERHVGQRFRQLRATLEACLRASPAAFSALSEAFSALDRRSAKLLPLARELHALEAAGELATSLSELAASLVHMHINRVLRSAHRAQELLIYDYLGRLYESEGRRAF